MTAAFEVFSGVQPWEENQSPSPPETTTNPYETTLALARSRSSGKQVLGLDTSNSLQRQLSPDPDSPPAAWKRRPSVASRTSQSPTNGVRSARSPSESSHLSSIAPSSRRHPGLMMTNADINDSDPLPLPQPSFRRRSGYSSGRSSIHSQDLSGLSSEELWKLGQEPERDMSNPLRPAAERPLDTIKRLSRSVEQTDYHAGLPVEVIWPTSPPELLANSAPVKSKSLTSVPSLVRKTTKKRPEKTSKIETRVAKSTPSTPMVNSPIEEVYISSAHSSSVSLSSHKIQPTKSMGALNGNRPPSTYYSRDFYSSLAPREGGYAIAAMMGNGLGAVGTHSAEERRRSMIPEDQNMPRNRPARAPMAKSAGMGRWSLDGGEQYSRRPYATPSAATTSSNLSAPPITSPDPSPPLDDGASTTPSMRSSLPEGAAPSAIPSASSEAFMSVPLAATASNPKAPSPLSQQTSPADIAPPSPLPAITPPALTHSKSKKDLAKEAKAAEKKAKLAEQTRKANQKAAEAKAKEDAKRAEKEEKARRKLEEKKAKLKSPSSSKLPFGKTAAPPMPVNAVQNVAAAKAESTPEPTTRPFPATSQSAYKVPAPSEEVRVPRQSMPLEAMGATPRISSAPTPSATVKEKKSKSRLSIFGTIKKKLSGEPSRPVQPTRAAPQPVIREQEEPVVVIGSQGAPLASISSRHKHLPEAPSSEATQTEAPQANQQWTTHEAPHHADPIDGLPAPTAAMDGLVQPEGSSQPTAHDQFQRDGTILTKTVSHDHAFSETKTRPRQSSLTGPRPMPKASPRPVSVSNPLDRSSIPTSAPLAPALAVSQQSLPPADPVTPSTSAGESSIFSNTPSTATSLTSDVDDSRKSSVASEQESASEEPVRENSSETIHIAQAPVVA